MWRTRKRTGYLIDPKADMFYFSQNRKDPGCPQ
jgi:hypothetical protein